MDHQAERITYYEEFAHQWENHRQQLRASEYQRRHAAHVQEAFEQARQGHGTLTPQDFVPWIFDPSTAEKVVVMYTIESGKAPETFPVSWAHEHGRFNEPPDVEKITFISGEKSFWV
jgi:hypothetical protein